MLSYIDSFHPHTFPNFNPTLSFDPTPDESRQTTASTTCCLHITGTTATISRTTSLDIKSSSKDLPKPKAEEKPKATGKLDWPNVKMKDMKAAEVNEIKKEEAKREGKRDAKKEKRQAEKGNEVKEQLKDQLKNKDKVSLCPPTPIYLIKMLTGTATVQNETQIDWGPIV
jgi:hypothetical protein